MDLEKIAGLVKIIEDSSLTEELKKLEKLVLILLAMMILLLKLWAAG